MKNIMQKLSTSQTELDFEKFEIVEIQDAELPEPFQLKFPGDTVTKRNDFTRYRLIMPYGKDPLANRLFACIVACYHNRKDKTLGECQVHVKEFMPWTNSAKDYTRVKQAMRALKSMLVELEVENKYKVDSILSGPITYYRKKAIIEAELNPRLADFFINLFEHYTAYGLLEFTSLKSFYSQRLFEIACSISHYKEEIFPLRKLQRMLDITEGSLLKYYEFKRWVLEPVKKEINANTNLKFNYEAIKVGRAVEHIKIKARRMDEKE